MKHHAMSMPMIVVVSTINAEFHALPIVDDMWNSKVLTNASARLAARGLFAFRSQSLGVSWKPSWMVILHMVSQPSKALAGVCKGNKSCSSGEEDVCNDSCEDPVPED